MAEFDLNFNTPGAPMMPRRISPQQMAPDLNFGGYQSNSPSSLLSGTGFQAPGSGMAAASAASEGNWYDGMFGKDGWGNLALGGANTLLQGYMGLKQLDMAKDQLDFQKQAFEKNYNAQRQRTNTQLRDRQKRRYYENPDYYASVDEYMAKNGVK